MIKGIRPKGLEWQDDFEIKPDITEDQWREMCYRWWELADRVLKIEDAEEDLIYRLTETEMDILEARGII